jgi:hypothetical protein
VAGGVEVAVAEVLADDGDRLNLAGEVFIAAGIEQAAFTFYYGGDESIVILSSASKRLWKWDIASEAVVAECTLDFTVDQWNTSHFDAPLKDGTFLVEDVNRVVRLRASDLMTLREWTRARVGLSSEILTGGAWHPASDSLLLRAGSTRRLYSAGSRATRAATRGRTRFFVEAGSAIPARG